MIFIYTCLILEKRLEKFSFAYATGTYIIVVVCVIVGVYCTMLIGESGIGQNVVVYKDNSFWTTVGFSIYVYEGIGVLMPIMKASGVKDHFHKLLIYAVIFLTILYIAFATLCYFAYGENLHEPIILNMLPNNNWLLVLVKWLYSISLICSFPLTIYAVW